MFLGITNGNIGSIWVWTRLTPNNDLERDGEILHGAWCSDTRQIKALVFQKMILGFQNSDTSLFKQDIYVCANEIK